MENWKAVVGYDGFYEVSDLGAVRALDRIIEQRGRWGNVQRRMLPGGIKTQTMSEPTPGYFRRTVGLSRDGKCSTRLVSHLVAEAFIGARPVGHEVAHCDGDSLNNCASNLRYALPADNTHDKFKHGTMLRGEQVASCKLTEEQARYIKSMRRKVRLIDLANEFGVRESAISRIQNGIRWAWL